MIPAILNALKKFLFDETAFLRLGRSLVMALAAGGMTYADQVAAALGAPGAVKLIKVASIAAMGLSLAFGAGDKTPQEVKDAARVITSTGYKIPEAP